VFVYKDNIISKCKTKYFFFIFIVKDSASNRLPTNDFKGSFHGLSQDAQPGSGSALARNKPLQPKYRHDCNDCTSLAALLVDRYVGMSLCSFEVSFHGNLKR